MSPSHNFTDRLKEVFSLAREEALRRQHDYVGTEHLLLGLISEGRGVGAAVLAKLSVDLEQVRGRVEGSITPGRNATPVGELPYTSRAKKVLDFAIAEAREFNHSYVGTEHLLLGLLREKKGIAAEVLDQVGVKLEDARRHTLILLGSSPQERPTPAASPRSSPRRTSSTNFRVFAQSALEAEALSAEVQSWINEREEDGFNVTEHSTQVVDGFVFITIWMQKHR